VLVGGLGIVLDQLAGSDEMTSNARGELLGQATQLLTDVAVELGSGDRLVEWRPVVTCLLLRARSLLAAGAFVTPRPAPLLATVPVASAGVLACRRAR
jgi:hypothetical protein